MAVLYNTLKDNFTQIPNALLTHSNLSNGAKVVYCYVASKPTGWKVWNKEIQQALNIKDSGTMSKYWKELLDTGWIARTRDKSENGQFSGGYDYELRIEPKMEKNRIRENPTLGKTPEHSNTDFNSNTNINNNTNIISPNGQNEETIINNTFNSRLTGKLLDVGNTKKPKQNGYTEVLNNLCSNEKVKDALLQYCKFRRSRGLTVQQWELIVKKFKQDSTNKTEQQIVDCIEQCIVNGRNSLYYTDYSNNDNKQAPQVQDDNPAVIKRSR